MKPPRKMPDWVYNQMIDGLQKLLVLRLQGAPPADTISALAAVWEEALTPHTWPFDEQLDHNRLPTAFKRVIQHAEKWVQPAQVIREIPPRSESAVSGLIEQKQPALSEAERERNRQYIQQLLNTIARAKRSINPNKEIQNERN